MLNISDTTIANTKIYLENVIRYARSTNLAETIYFFTAFDESWKLGNGADPVEGNFGIHFQNLTPKFQFDISSYSEFDLIRPNQC
jgi:exo-beta-1,3-glucanase (GH17 family)